MLSLFQKLFFLTLKSDTVINLETKTEPGPWKAGGSVSITFLLTPFYPHTVLLLDYCSSTLIILSQVVPSANRSPCYYQSFIFRNLSLTMCCPQERSIFLSMVCEALGVPGLVALTLTMISLYLKSHPPWICKCFSLWAVVQPSPLANNALPHISLVKPFHHPSSTISSFRSLPYIAHTWS